MKLKPKRALLLIIILSVVLLAFKTDTIAYLLSDKNYEDAAERMATFIADEYNRQKARLGDGRHTVCYQVLELK